MSALLCFFIVVMLCCSNSYAQLGCTELVKIDKELFVTHPSVIDHHEARADGAFSFSSIFKKMSRTRTESAAQQALEGWLSEWDRTVTESGIPSTPRSTSSLKWVWPKEADGKLSLVNAPFVLNSVVFRPDIQDISDVSGRDIVGEVRFIFNLVNLNNKMAEQFSIIFEFPLYSDQNAMWLEKIHQLGKLSWGDSYNNHLIKILNLLDTTEVRLRTNDFYLSFEWDMRQFQLNKNQKIEMQALPKTPHIDFSLKQSLASDLSLWITGNKNKIETGIYEIDFKYRTANAATPGEEFKWLDPINSFSLVEESLRQKFSVQSCNGCHAGETQTRFTHIDPRDINGPVQFSQFLKLDLIERKNIFEDRLCRRTGAIKKSLARRIGREH